jgi:hypothetical protein
LVGNLSKRHCVEFLAPFVKVAYHIGSYQSAHVELFVLLTATSVNGDDFLIHADGGATLSRKCAKTVSDQRTFRLNKDNFVISLQTVLFESKLLSRFIVTAIVVVIFSRVAKYLKAD